MTNKDFKYVKEKNDKYNAVWLSYSSISDFKKCPQLYYLKNVWKNSNKRKVNIVSPHMSLGSAVHQTIEPLGLLKVEDRLKILDANEIETNLFDIYNKNWTKFTGKMGGFLDIETEKEFKQMGVEMLQNVLENRGPIKQKTIKFYTGDFIPNIYLSEEENVILCGLVDWVEYIDKDDSLRVIDFKTGKHDEKEDSFQLPIYKILVESLQKRKVKSGAYWYLRKDKFPTEIQLVDEDVEEIKSQILKIGIDIKQRKQDNKFECKYKTETGESCFDCRDFEMIKNFDEGNVVPQIEYLGVGEYKQDLYLIIK